MKISRTSPAACYFFIAVSLLFTFQAAAQYKEISWKDWQVDEANEKYVNFATDSKTYFTNPGKYTIYMLPQNATNTGATIGNHERYYGKASLLVK